MQPAPCERASRSLRHSQSGWRLFGPGANHGVLRTSDQPRTRIEEHGLTRHDIVVSYDISLTKNSLSSLRGKGERDLYPVMETASPSGSETHPAGGHQVPRHRGASPNAGFAPPLRTSAIHCER